jgi:GR25 family glycosyltransferase involved in LPS biosynthesis
MLPVDHVLYINLNKRIDKFIYILDECKRVGIPPEKMTRIEAIYIPDIGMLGCSLSHCKALELALSHPEWTWTLIIEDDAKFKDNPWTEVEEALKNTNPDVLMLSRGAAIAKEQPHSSSSNLYKIVTACGSVAYIVHKNYIPKLLKTIRESIEAFTKPGGNVYDHPLDVYWYSIQKTDNWYAFLVSVAWHDQSLKSDIR